MLARLVTVLAAGGWSEWDKVFCRTARTDAMLEEYAERVESARRDVHDWSDRTVTHALVLFLFYGGLAITGLGLLVVAASYVVARQ